MSTVWNGRSLLRVYPNEPTTEDTAQTSHSGQQRTNNRGSRMLPRSFQVAGLLEIRPAQSVGQLPLRPVTGSIQSEILFKVFLQPSQLAIDVLRITGTHRRYLPESRRFHDRSTRMSRQSFVDQGRGWNHKPTLIGANNQAATECPSNVDTQEPGFLWNAASWQ